KVEFALFLIVAPRVVTMMLLTYIKNIFLAENQFGKSIAIDVIQPILNIAMVAALLLSRNVSVETILWSGTISVVVTTAWAIIAIHKIYPWQLHFDFSLWKQLLTYG